MKITQALRDLFFKSKLSKTDYKQMFNGLSFLVRSADKLTDALIRVVVIDLKLPNTIVNSFGAIPEKKTS